MDHYFFTLIPPRPTFSADMTPAERTVMQQHVGYWRGLVEDGTAVVFGPVADPAGFWGAAVFLASGQEEAQALAAKDPAIASGLVTCAVHAMPGAIVRT
jgi:uncharacterized protein YciI